jgi:hypothetical protein
VQFNDSLLKVYNMRKALKNNAIRILSSAVIVCSYAACSSSPAPHLGATTTQVTEPSGLTITQQDTRELLANGSLAGTETELKQMKAKVVAIDSRTRMVTLQGVDGSSASIKADETVRNFPQLKIGDQVAVDFLETVSFEVRPPTAEELKNIGTVAVLGGRADLGQKPGALIGAGTTTVVKITGVDKEKQLISYLGQNGTAGKVKAKYPENLALVKAGDTVVVTASELVAANVVAVN